MIGPELAALLAPFAKWGAIVLAGVLLVVLGYRAIGRGAVSESEKQAMRKMQKDRHATQEELRSETEKARARLRRIRDARRRE